MAAKTKIFRWLTYNVLFAFIPVGFFVLARVLLMQDVTVQNFSRTPELLFFSLMLSGTALGDLSDNAPLQSVHLLLLKSALFVTTVLSTLLYATQIVVALKFPVGTFDVELSVGLAIGLAIASLLVATTTEVLLSLRA